MEKINVGELQNFRNALDMDILNCKVYQDSRTGNYLSFNFEDDVSLVVDQWSKDGVLINCIMFELK